MRIQGRSQKSRLRKNKQKFRELLDLIPRDGWIECQFCGFRDHLRKEQCNGEQWKCFKCNRNLFSKFREPQCLNPNCNADYSYLITCERDGDVVCSLCGFVSNSSNLISNSVIDLFVTTTYRGYLRRNHLNERLAETTLKGPKIETEHFRRIRKYCEKTATIRNIIRGGRRYFTNVGKRLGYANKKYGERWVSIRFTLGWEIGYEPLPQNIADNIRGRFVWLENAHNDLKGTKKHMINLNYLILQCLWMEDKGGEVFEKWGKYYADVKGEITKLNEEWKSYIKYINNIKLSNRIQNPYQWPLHVFSFKEIWNLNVYI